MDAPIVTEQNYERANDQRDINSTDRCVRSAEKPHLRGRWGVGELLAVSVPLACTLSSVAWAISTYLMVREQQRAQVEIAVWGARGK